jgi:hypothetical protein
MHGRLLWPRYVEQFSLPIESYTRSYLLTVRLGRLLPHRKGLVDHKFGKLENPGA